MLKSGKKTLDKKIKLSRRDLLDMMSDIFLLGYENGLRGQIINEQTAPEAFEMTCGGAKVKFYATADKNER